MKKNSFVGHYTALFLFVLLVGAAVISCKEKDKDVVKPKTITDIILENNDFTILREIVKAAGMTDALRTDNITLFAPNDAAFRSSNITNASVITSLPKDSSIAFIKHHVLDAKKAYTYKELPKGDVKVLDGKTVKIQTVSSSDTTLMINRAYVILKNVSAANGYIQVVDRTLKLK
jgi:uncharacterized surface protein with fasciclin (FAS1) repeats